MFTQGEWVIDPNGVRVVVVREDELNDTVTCEYPPKAGEKPGSKVFRRGEVRKLKPPESNGTMKLSPRQWSSIGAMDK
jgi:hypothetical protein